MPIKYRSEILNLDSEVYYRMECYQRYPAVTYACSKQRCLKMASSNVNISEARKEICLFLLHHKWIFYLLMDSLN